jgi:hypothetical protein
MRSAKKRARNERLLSNKRWGISLGITMLAIGYNLFPVKGPVGLLWAGGILVMSMGIWILYTAFLLESSQY